MPPTDLSQPIQLSFPLVSTAFVRCSLHEGHVSAGLFLTLAMSDVLARAIVYRRDRESRSYVEERSSSSTRLPFPIGQ
jgi:hypothetical protein